MTNSDERMPEGTVGTQETVQKPAAEQAASETKEAPKAPTLSEQMFGGKIKPKEEPKQPDSDEQPPDAQNAQQPKKGAKERIQELAREKNTYKADAEEKAKEIDRLKSELMALQKTEEKDKTAKDQYREAVIEEKLKEHMTEMQAELMDYSAKSGNPEMFETNYNYYIPILNEHDPWTISQIIKFPERTAMLDKFFQAITSGVFSVQEWVEAAQPLKMQKIMDLRKLVQEGGKPAETKKEEPKKNIPDSVVPDLNPKSDLSKDLSERALFNKAFGKKR